MLTSVSGIIVKETNIQICIGK